MDALQVSGTRVCYGTEDDGMQVHQRMHLHAMLVRVNSSLVARGTDPRTSKDTSCIPGLDRSTYGDRICPVC